MPAPSHDVQQPGSVASGAESASWYLPSGATGARAAGSASTPHAHYGAVQRLTPSTSHGSPCRTESAPKGALLEAYSAELPPPDLALISGEMCRRVAGINPVPGRTFELDLFTRHRLDRAGVEAHPALANRIWPVIRQRRVREQRAEAHSGPVNGAHKQRRLGLHSRVHREPLSPSGSECPRLHRKSFAHHRNGSSALRPPPGE